MNIEDNNLSSRMTVRDNPTAPTSMSLTDGHPSTIYDKKSFELSVSTRSTSLPFPDEKDVALHFESQRDALPFVVPFNAAFRRFIENDLYNERLLCVVNVGDLYYGANLVNSLETVLSTNSDTYVYCPRVKSQQVQLVRRDDATIEDSLKNRLGYNFAYHQMLIDYGLVKDAKYSTYLSYIRNRLAVSLSSAEKFLRFVPSKIHSITYYRNRYYFGSNHGLFTCENPFLEYNNVSQTSVVWPYGIGAGSWFREDDVEDPLHAGLFNHFAVTMSSEDEISMTPLNVYINARDTSITDIEKLLPQFNVYKLLPVSLSGEISGALSVSVGKRVEALAATDNGLWALVNTIPPDQTEVPSSHSWAYPIWEEDQVPKHPNSQQWIQCNGSTRDPDGNDVFLTDLKITSIVMSDNKMDQNTCYLGTPTGMFTYTIGGACQEIDEDDESGDPELKWVVNGSFSRMYGYYDAEVRTETFVHPEGYTGSVLAGTNYGVLHGADGWFPNIVKYDRQWVTPSNSLEFDKDPPTSFGLKNKAPAIVGRSSGLYKVDYDNEVHRTTLTRIMEDKIKEVYAIYDIGLTGWVVLARTVRTESNKEENRVAVFLVNKGSLDSTWSHELDKTSKVTHHTVSPGNNVYFTADGENQNRVVYKVQPHSNGRDVSVDMIAMNELKESGKRLPENEKIIGITASVCDELLWYDVLFIATELAEPVSTCDRHGGSLYAVMPKTNVEQYQFVPSTTITGGSDVKIVAHCKAENGLDTTVLQTGSKTYLVKTANLQNAPSDWKQVSDQKDVLDTRATLVNMNGRNILVSYSGVFFVGTNGSGDLSWVGTSEDNPLPVIKGHFTGACVVDNGTDIPNEGGKFLMLTTEEKKLLMYSFIWNSVESQNGTPVFWDSLEDLTSPTGSESHPGVVLSPLNSEGQLSALVVYASKMHSAYAVRGSNNFDPATVKPEFTYITLP